MTLILIAAIGVLLYTYLLYPLGTRIAAARVRERSTTPAGPVSISVALPVYNEAAIISRCLDSVLRSNYPEDLVQVVLGSDCSTDGTDAILASYAARDPRISFIRYDVRRGKEFLLNDLVQRASNDILILIDADVELDPMMIANHARHFADRSVGAVAGLLAYSAPGDNPVVSSERYYQSFEERLRRAESKLGATVGLFGGNYSMRRSLWRPIPSSVIHDDFYTVLSLLDAKKRILFEPEAVVLERYARTAKEEFRRRARFAARGLRTVTYFPQLLSPSRGRIALMLWSHKILRWGSPFLLLAVTIALLYLECNQDTPLVRMLLFVGGAATLCSALGYLFDRLKLRIALFRHAYWFLVINAAFLLGVFNFVFRREKSLWKKTTRASSVKSQTEETVLP